jgi:RNA polymerase sigma-70 factor (ECF subfamily)
MAEKSEFEALVDLYYPGLYRFAFSLTNSESDACDLTQDTFLIWARKGHQMRDQAKAKSWLFTTLHREFLQKRRRITRFPQIEINEAEPELPEVPPATPEKLDRQTIHAALAKLDENFQTAVSLFYLEDYSYPEIAEILAIPLGTVKSRISRGVLQLQHLLVKPELSSKGGVA